ncbi:hypothetical protein EVAR_95280_1 [Eumeta japonica]|uniref:Uncharacterized protein n=1 Tax=Eumeta variegata TaxID=151549 RepID=A0A4C1UK11_EUMVA|nr:hypothetical protein EVAR_95280_1 [Eumeta japonica]
MQLNNYLGGSFHVGLRPAPTWPPTIILSYEVIIARLAVPLRRGGIAQGTVTEIFGYGWVKNAGALTAGYTLKLLSISKLNRYLYHHLPPSAAAAARRMWAG